MYILMIFPPLISGYIIFPVLIGLFFDTKKSDTQTMSVLKNFTVGYVGGVCLFYIIYYLVNSLFLRTSGFFDVDWRSGILTSVLFTLGIILPILFGVLLIYVKLKTQLNSKALTTQDIVAGVMYIIFMVFYLIQFGRFVFPLYTTLAVILFPGLTGLWLASKISTHTWKYFVVYILFALPSLFFFLAFSYG